MAGEGLMHLVAPSWVVWIVAGVLLNSVVHWKSYMPKVFLDVMEYGKLRSGESKSSTFLNWLNPSFPKRWFTHFYAWGVVWNYSIFIYYTLFVALDRLEFSVPVVGPLVEVATGDYVLTRCNRFAQRHFDTFVVLLFICVQVSRRLYECLFVSVFSNSRMSIVHYVLGIYFYSSVGLTALLHIDPYGVDQDNEVYLVLPAPYPEIFGNFLHWNHIIGILIFLWASTHQHTCHSILANLRKTTTRPTKTEYGMPEGDWFEYVSSPHFFAEILIYAGLLMCQAPAYWCPPMLLVLLSTCCTLGLSARQTHMWYQKKFEDYPLKRRIIFPWIY